MAKAMGLTHCLTSLQPRSAFWLAAVHTKHSSMTYQCPPLCPIHLGRQQKEVAHDGFPLELKLSVFFIVNNLIAF